MSHSSMYFKFKMFKLEIIGGHGMMEIMTEMLLIEPREGWTKLVLNRPDVRNALNTAVLATLAETLDRLAMDAGCRAVLMCGTGGNFAAGADLGEIEHKGRIDGAKDPRKGHWAQIRRFPKPLVAAVDGYCLGGGLELALLADCIVLGASAKLGLPETNLGLIPGAGGCQRLTALIGRARATRMVLTGEIIEARLAHDWGIAGWLSDGVAESDAETLTAKLAQRAPLALQAAKQALVAASESAHTEDLANERASFEALLDSADKREGIAAFREKRKPIFQGK